MQKETSIIHAFRLQPGQDLRKEIETYTQQKRIQAGWIITCVGSLTQAQLRYANQVEDTTLPGPFEIVSLAGTIGIGGVHLHLSISNSKGDTIGGHLLIGCLIYTTAEIIIGESTNLRFTREQDGSTPWKELQIIHTPGP